MKLFKNAKRTLSLLLTVIMALTMMSVMSVSAEDTTETETETVSVYDRFSWSPLKDVTATAEKTTTTSTVTNEAYAFEGTVPAKSTTYAIENVTNDDGTITSSKIRTTKTYVDNGDGTATETTEIRTVASTVENPILENGTFFKFGVYSDRDDASRGYHYATYLEPYINWDRYGQYGGGFENPTNKEYHNQHAIMIEVPEDNKLIGNAARSYYLTKNHIAGMQNTLMYRVQQHNEMALTFVAPENGVYTVSGDISKVTTAGYTDSEEGYVKYYLAKIDEDGIEHVLTEAKKLPERDTAIDELPDVKVALKAGEQLVLKTDNNLNFICKLYLEDYLVTKWDYAEAEDSSTVTVNYGYQNHNFYNVYGENYAIGDSNFNTLWDVKAARYVPETDELDATVPTLAFTRKYITGSVIRLFAHGNSFADTTSQGTKNPGMEYDTTNGNLTARLYNGATSSVSYKFGLQFTFTVPEDGTVVLTGADQGASRNTIARVGIKKKDSDEVVYGIYYNTSGGTTYGTERGIWNFIGVSDAISARTHNLGELEAGDVIYYEMSTHDVTSTGTKTSDLSTINVAITSSNSAVDLNGDFKGDASDAAYLRKFLLKTFTASDSTIFDVTGDGIADIRDLVKIKKVLAGVA